MFNDGFFFHPGKFICIYDCEKLGVAGCLSEGTFLIIACCGPIVYCHICIFRSVRQHNTQIVNSRRERNEKKFNPPPSLYISIMTHPLSSKEINKIKHWLLFDTAAHQQVLQSLPCIAQVFLFLVLLVKEGNCVANNLFLFMWLLEATSSSDNISSSVKVRAPDKWSELCTALVSFAL